MNHRFTIVGIGEALFDIFGSRERLGGAPLNVAVHAQQLLAATGAGRGVLVSRVGQDELGKQLLDQLTQRGMNVDYIQSDPDRPTGRVAVTRNDQGQPAYDIVGDVAWDMIHYDPDLDGLARSADAITFGTLAQREGQSRSAIHRFLIEARSAIRLFDVNLRSSRGKDFFSRPILQRSCELATLIKLNDEEMPAIGKMLGVDSPEALRSRYDLDAVLMTRGEEGTAAFTRDGFVEGGPAQAHFADDADPVGAGDSCSAAFLAARLCGASMQESLDLANRVSAYVVGRSGATPPLPDELLESLKH